MLRIFCSCNFLISKCFSKVANHVKLKKITTLKKRHSIYYNYFGESHSFEKLEKVKKVNHMRHSKYKFYGQTEMARQRRTDFSNAIFLQHVCDYFCQELFIICDLSLILQSYNGVILNPA